MKRELQVLGLSVAQNPKSKDVQDSQGLTLYLRQSEHEWETLTGWDRREIPAARTPKGNLSI